MSRERLRFLLPPEEAHSVIAGVKKTNSIVKRKRIALKIVQVKEVAQNGLSEAKIKSERL